MNICRGGIFAFVILFLQHSLHAQFTYVELKVDYETIWTYKNLQLIPVRLKEKNDGPATGTPVKKRPLSLSEAMQKNKVNIKELQYQNNADINWLQVTNHSNQDVMIQSGEMLGGGKQDRMIAETKVIAAGKTDYLNVYCIEKRRWDKKPKKFRYKGVANSKVRKVMDVSKRQPEIWKEIDQQFTDQKKKSETWSYLQLPLPADTGYIPFFTRKYLQDNKDVAGFIFITGNQIISTELFSSAELLKISFGNILSSNVQFAISKGAPPAVSKEATAGFMDKILLNDEVQKKYIAAHGKIFMSEGKKIHLVAYGN